VFSNTHCNNAKRVFWNPSASMVCINNRHTAGPSLRLCGCRPARTSLTSGLVSTTGG